MSMKNVRFAALVFSVVSASVAFAAGEVQKARFEAWLDPIRQGLNSSSTGSAAVKKLGTITPARVAAFNLQALGRLYSAEDPEFREIAAAFKGLEDGIGQVDKWNNILAAAEERGEPDKELKRLRDKIKEAEADFVSYLDSEGWMPGTSSKAKFRQIESFLANRVWQSDKKDREMLLGQILKRLKRIRDTDFDMTKLEEGDGLHEFRRQLRWFLIEARVLDGLMVFRDNKKDCSIKDYAGLVDEPISESKYSQLPPSQFNVDACKISQCLFLGFVATVDDIGKIKDKIEADNNIGGETDEVPEKYRTKAEEILKDFEKRGAAREIIKQVEKCGVQG
jgi:hypothetical protein